MTLQMFVVATTLLPFYHVKVALRTQ